MNLSTAVGQRVRQLRDERAWTQEDVAQRARGLGLEWKRASVALLETGRRDLSASELLVLPLVFNVKLGDLIPDGEDIELNDRLLAPPQVIRSAILRGTSSGISVPYIPRISEAEERAALRLGVTEDEVEQLAMGLWGSTLTDERDRRIAERGDIPLESRRAIRGRVTRKLIEELRAELEQGGK